MKVSRSHHCSTSHSFLTTIADHHLPLDSSPDFLVQYTISLCSVPSSSVVTHTLSTHKSPVSSSSFVPFLSKSHAHARWTTTTTLSFRVCHHAPTILPRTTQIHTRFPRSKRRLTCPQLLGVRTPRRPLRLPPLLSRTVRPVVLAPSQPSTERESSANNNNIPSEREISERAQRDTSEE